MSDAPIPLSYPDITDAEVSAVVRVLRSGRLSLGPELDRFESMVARRAGREHGIGVSSGTAGLHLGLLALGVGPGDEVITPAFSFIASANCIVHAGATPVFVDCDAKTLNMSLPEVERRITDRTKAIIGVEVFGNPAGMAELAALCNRHEIPLVEDCCEGIGAAIDDRPVGSFGRIGVFSFYPNKTVTAGEGGMIVTDDDRLADTCRSLRNQGRAAGAGGTLGSWLAHERVGFNCRLSELHAALGAAQMRRLDELIDARRRVATSYTRCLGGNCDLILPTVEPNVSPSWFVYVVRLNDHFSADDRDTIIEGLRRHDVGAANYFPPIPLHEPYLRLGGYREGDFPVAESIGHRTIALPFFTRLTDHEIDLVCQTLELMISRVTFARR